MTLEAMGGTLTGGIWEEVISSPSCVCLRLILSTLPVYSTCLLCLFGSVYSPLLVQQI